jgi:hypothetical protein
MTDEHMHKLSEEIDEAWNNRDALDSQHGMFCSCQSCIDFRHATRVQEMEAPISESHGFSYKPRTPWWKHWLVGAVGIALFWIALFVAAPPAARWLIEQIQSAAHK